MSEEIQEPLLLSPGAGENGSRLDRFLAGALPDFSRSRLQSLIREGFVQINGRACTKARQPVRENDRIRVDVPPPEAAEILPESIPLNILYEDDDLIAINKPAGLVVHPGAGNDRGTLVNALLHHCRGQLSGIGGVERPGIVHRLDKDTSGCIVIAKNDIAHRKLSESFSGREVEKTYLCVVSGRITESEGTVKNHIGRNPGNRQKMAIVDERHGRFAHTDWRVRAVGNDYTVVQCRIHTGRTHQIRVHMAYALGHPILGDPIYGKGTLKHENATRLLLHAWRLSIDHPVTGERLNLEAPIPPEIRELIV